ncbi:CyaA/EF/ExoY family adenylyl cyclase toxin [Sansalvadorimonas sp. 2012CJ34-2]|uniref:CyaA/EF/ExoY family adenylyl cyclase toxin n=1 Tax=Parendozoicomonas callyspongiae TaxID=2942213 RepID=A0ABT0PIP0_9GAMM|nr:CyaA/EF/ExoY family adenylyl cyclase toxin [Sansalvadorimonas sp. 2012CJ34-2]MCL6271233.1 CyaA/EF/ExoY family adenylyl cyclase toxin [Sansalvadorimonas sp. 2012CJ34-2]
MQNIIDQSQGPVIPITIEEDRSTVKETGKTPEFNLRKVSSSSTDSSDSAYSSGRENGDDSAASFPRTSGVSLTAPHRKRRSGLSNFDAPVGPEKTSEELMIDSMVWGVEEVAADKKQGLPKKYIEDFILAVDERGNPFAIRPVDALCKRPILEGNPTKPFPIKGKSSSWGLQQSFICIDQHYSKLHGEDEALVDKYNKEVAGISSVHAIPSQLKISTARIEELETINSGHFERLETIKDKAGNPCQIKFKVFANDWTEFTQVAELNKDGYWYIFNVVDGKKEPLNVLCHPEKKLPITADADPLFEAFPREELDLGGKDRLPVPLIAPGSVYGRLDKYERRASRRRSSNYGPLTQEEAFQERRRETHIAKLRRESKLNKFLEPEIQDIGNVSPRTYDMIRHYGKSEVSAINRDNPLVHHNTDCTSPFSKLEDNFPATIYFPRKVIEAIPAFKRKNEQVVTVYNKEQLKLIIQLLVDNNYYMFINPMWGDLADIRPKWFTENRAVLEAKMPFVKQRLNLLQHDYDKKQANKKVSVTQRRVRKHAVWDCGTQYARAVRKFSQVGSLIKQFELGTVAVY